MDSLNHLKPVACAECPRPAVVLWADRLLCSADALARAE